MPAESEFDGAIGQRAGDWPASDLPGPSLTIEITALELEALIIHQHDRAQACAAQRDHHAEMIHVGRASYLLQQLARIAPERVSPHKDGQS